MVGTTSKTLENIITTVVVVGERGGCIVSPGNRRPPENTAERGLREKPRARASSFACKNDRHFFLSIFFFFSFFFRPSTTHKVHLPPPLPEKYSDRFFSHDSTNDAATAQFRERIPTLPLRLSMNKCIPSFVSLTNNTRQQDQTRHYGVTWRYRALARKANVSFHCFFGGKRMLNVKR